MRPPFSGKVHPVHYVSHRVWNAVVPVAQIILEGHYAGGACIIAHLLPGLRLHIPQHRVGRDIHCGAGPGGLRIPSGNDRQGRTRVRVQKDRRIIQGPPHVVAVQVAEPPHRVPCALIHLLYAHVQSGIPCGPRVYHRKPAGKARAKVVDHALDIVVGHILLYPASQKYPDALVHPYGQGLPDEVGSPLRRGKVAGVYCLCQRVDIRILVVPKGRIVEPRHGGEPWRVHLRQSHRIIPDKARASPSLRIQVPLLLCRIRAVHHHERLVQIPKVLIHREPGILQLQREQLPDGFAGRVVAAYHKGYLDRTPVHCPYALLHHGAGALHCIGYHLIGQHRIVLEVVRLEVLYERYVLGVKRPVIGGHGHPVPGHQLVDHQIAVQQIVDGKPHVAQGERVERIRLGGVQQYAVRVAAGLVDVNALPVLGGGQPLGGYLPKVHVDVSLAHLLQCGVFVQILYEPDFLKVRLGVCRTRCQACQNRSRCCIRNHTARLRDIDLRLVTTDSTTMGSTTMGSSRKAW